MHATLTIHPFNAEGSCKNEITQGKKKHFKCSSTKQNEYEFSKAGGGGTLPFTIKPTFPGVIRRCSRLDTPGIVIMQTDIQIPITSPDFQELSIIFDFHNHCSKSYFKEYSIHLKESLLVDEQRDGDG